MNDYVEGACLFVGGWVDRFVDLVDENWEKSDSLIVDRAGVDI